MRIQTFYHGYLFRMKKYCLFRTNFASCQQIACLRQSVEEKYNIPPKPKRPLTPYFKFMVQIRPEIKRDKPNAKVTDIVRETALRWEKIEPQVKNITQHTCIC